MRPDSFVETARRCRSTTRATAGCRPACRAPSPRWDAALRRYGTWRSGARSQPAIRRRARRASWSTRRSTTRSRPTSPGSTTSRRPRRSTWTPTAPPRDVGAVLRNPDLAAHVRALARHGAEALLPRAGRRGDGRAVAHPPIAAGRRPRAGAPGLMTAARPARVRREWRAPTRVGYRGLDVYGMGPPSSGGVDRRRGAQHPRARCRVARWPTRASCTASSRRRRYAFADRNALRRRPGVLRRPAARAALGRVRGRARRA